MRRIVLAQNAVISGLITLITIITGFWGVHGGRLMIVSVMLFAVFDWSLLRLERMYIRRTKNEKDGSAEGERGSVPGIWWYKVRYRRGIKKNRDTAGDTAAV